MLQITSQPQTWWLSRETGELSHVTGLLPGGMDETKLLSNAESKIYLLSREG